MYNCADIQVKRIFRIVKFLPFSITKHVERYGELQIGILGTQLRRLPSYVYTNNQRPH